MRKIVDVHERRRRPHLDPDEDDDHEEPSDDAGPRPRVAPTPQHRLLQSEDAQPDPDRDEHGAAVVDPRRDGLVLGLGHERQHQRDDRHRHVHPEDGPPRPLRQVAAEDRPDRGQAAGDAEEDGERLAPLTQGKGAHHDGQRGREHQRATRTLHDAEGHDPRLGDAALGRQIRTSPTPR